MLDIIKISFLKKINTLIGIVAFIFTVNSFAEGNKINNIEIEGNTRTERSTVVTYLSLKKGSDYTQDKADESIKTLYNTGFFSKIDINFKSGVVVVSVVENPIINKIDFIGNKALKTDVLSQELLSKNRDFFSRSKLSNDVSRLLDVYNKAGRFSTKIRPQTAKLPQNRVNILFEIEEGKKSTIKKIIFIGNNRFSSNELKSQIMSKEDRIYNLLRVNYYDSDIVEYDKVLLTKFYHYHGYANFKVISADADIVPGTTRFVLTFSIEEGDKYNFGKVELRNEILQVQDQDISKLIRFKEGEQYNAKLIEDSTQAIIKYLAVSGYPFVDVRANTELDKDNKLVNMEFVISKSPKFYVGRININGNLKTYDSVIRRELRISEGDPYNSFFIENSEQRLKDLDFFEKVEIKAEKTLDKDVVDLIVNVEEKSTASLNFSAGYSTSDGPIGIIGFTEKNLLGQGKKVNLNVQKSPVIQGVNFSLTQPNFLQSTVDAGFSAKVSERNNTTSSLGAQSNSLPFKSRDVSAAVFMNYDITDNLSHSVNYSISNETIDGVVPGSAAIINEQTGRNIVSSVGHGLSYNRTDSRINPTSGYALNLNQILAGLGGDSRFLKDVLEGSYYYPITDNLVLKIASTFGNIYGLGKYVRINENFVLGGYTLRGFDYAGVGPRDKGANADALGGKNYYTGTIELKFPVPGLPKDSDVSAAIFSDIGSLWDIDIPSNSQYHAGQFFNNKSPRVSVGIGFIWVTSVAPFRVDFARAMKKEPYDKLRPFLFSFSALF